MDMYDFFFYGLVLVTGGLWYRGREAASVTSPETPGFRSFKAKYLTGYFLCVAGDWLQGPYVYALYSAYGFEKHDIAVLFVAGFGSSMVVGTFLGSLADRCGRKLWCQLYCVMYILSCITKHWNNYNILLVGRLLGGVATSLLFSVFDAWLVCEHNARGHDPAWLSSTFSTAMFGNSVVAIVCGTVSQWAADAVPLTSTGEPGDDEVETSAFMYGGYCAPFDMAIVVLVLGGLYMSGAWSENYGEPPAANAQAPSQLDALRKGAAVVFRDPRVLLVGLCSALFEGSMFTFVFMWTPALTPPGESPPYGKIFATFMVACMAGSKVFGSLMRITGGKPERFMRGLFALAAAALATPVVTTSVPVVAAAFLVFEACVGVYFPAMGTLKSKYVPEDARAAVYSIYRVPLNAIVLFVLLGDFEPSTAFALCSAMLLVASLCGGRLAAATAAPGGGSVKGFAADAEDSEDEAPLIRA